MRIDWNGEDQSLRFPLHVFRRAVSNLAESFVIQSGKFVNRLPANSMFREFQHSRSTPFCGNSF
jgi:hypothetical protein